MIIIFVRNWEVRVNRFEKDKICDGFNVFKKKFQILQESKFLDFGIKIFYFILKKNSKLYKLENFLKINEGFHIYVKENIRWKKKFPKKKIQTGL